MREEMRDVSPILTTPEIAWSGIEAGPDERVGVRDAVAADREHFAELWRAFLAENATRGAQFAPDEPTLRFFMEIFDKIVSGGLKGAALYDPAGAVLLWPIVPVPFNYNFPDVGIVPSSEVGLGYGTYLIPAIRGGGRGFAVQLMGLARLREDGARFFLGGVPYDNKMSAGLSVKHGTSNLGTTVLLPLEAR